MAIRLIFNPKSGWTGTVKSEPITYRELMILTMAAQGYNNKEIAEGLGIAYQTVKNNFYKLMKKLGAKNNAHALIIAMQSGMISFENISDDMDESLKLSTEKRQEIRSYIMKEIEIVNKMSRDEADKYMAEQNKLALGYKPRKKKSK